MKHWLVSLWWTLALLLCGSVEAKPLMLSAVEDGRSVNRHLTHWRDANGRADLATAEAAWEAGEFTSLNGTSAFGIDPAAHWFRLELRRLPDTPELWLLELPHPGLDHVRLYSPSSGGIHLETEAGDHQVFSARPVQNRNFVFPLHLPVDQAVVLYLRIQTADTLIVPLRLWTPDRFVEADTGESILIGCYYGLILAMLVYNLFLFVKLRDSLYAYYILFTAVMLLVVAELNGHAFQYLFPNNLWLADRQHVILPAAAIHASLLFMRHLFDLGNAAPRLNRAILWLHSYALAGLAIGLGFDYALGHQMLILALPVQSALGLIAGVQAWRRGYRPAIYYLTAQVCFQGGIAVVVANALGIWSSGILIQQAFSIGSALEIMLFSQALAERISMLRKEKEKALRLRDEAEFASRAQSKILASASHDLRQPIQALGLFLGALSHHAKDATIRDIVDKMETSIRSLSELLDTFLDISRLDSGVIRPNLQPVALSDVFARLVDEFDLQATSARLRLKIWLPHQEIVVKTDPGLLLTVLRNLMSNALRYTPEGGLLLSGRRRGGEILIQVWDTGIGIPATEHRHVFREFYQLATAIPDSRKGLGLGLSIVSRVAHLLGYTVDLCSVVGQGSVFSIRLPEMVEAMPAALPSSVGIQRPSPGGMVLLIEDNADVLEGLRLYLSMAGYAVVTATSQDAAIAAMTAHDAAPDIVISDFSLGPVQNGADAIAAVTAHCRQRFGREPLGLIVTGETAPEILRIIETRGFAVLHKPVDGTTLARRIDALIAASPAPTFSE